MTYSSGSNNPGGPPRKSEKGALASLAQTLLKKRSLDQWIGWRQTMQLFVVTNHRTDMNLTTSLVILVIFPFFTQIFTTLLLLIHHTTHCASIAHRILPFLDLSLPISGIMSARYFSKPQLRTFLNRIALATVRIISLNIHDLFTCINDQHTPLLGFWIQDHLFYAYIFLCKTK